MIIRAIAYAFTSFAASLLTHILVWKRKIPRNDALSLVWIFLIIPLGIYAAVGSYRIVGSDALIGEAIAHFAFCFFLHAALSLVYISTYPAVQATSPSLDILLLVAKAPGGMTEDELIRNYTVNCLVGDRLQDLLNYNLIHRDGDQYSVRPRARMIVGFFDLYRKMLGLPAGEG